MKTKQANLKAVFTTECDNGENHGNKMEQVSRYKLIDKKTEACAVDVAVYMGRSRNAETVKASIWVNLSDKKKPNGWEYRYTSGTGQAGGWGYDKESAAVGDAIRSAGIELYGCPYASQGKVDMKRKARIDGVGSSAIEKAILAIGYAAGYSDCIFVSC